MTPRPAHFPYAFTPLTGLPAWARFRAEGQPPSACVWGGLYYCLKYWRKLAAAPPEAIAYFREQRELLRFLADAPLPQADASLAMVGDLMWIRSGWTTFVNDRLLGHLNAHDVVLGNLETVISPRFGVPRWRPDCIHFNSDPALIASFRRPDGRNTFTALATASNHTLDFHDDGARDVLAFLAEQGIRQSGVREGPDGKPYAVVEANGIRIGFYAATWGHNDRTRAERSALAINTVPGLAPEDGREADLSGVRDALAAMDEEGVDFKVVALHWGFEYELYPSPPQVQVGREIVRAGADVILGTHPHVVQPAEVCFLNGYERRYATAADRLAALRHPTGCVIESEGERARKALVLYSLGNFTTAMVTFLCRLGVVWSLELRRDPDTGHVDWAMPPARLVYNVKRAPATGRRRLMFLGDHMAELAGKQRAKIGREADEVMSRVMAAL